MSLEGWITAAVILAVLVALAREIAPPPFVVFGAVVALLLLDVISAEQALAGFANPAPITVAALYVVARAVQRTGGVSAAVEVLMAGRGPGRRTTVRGALSRMLPPVMASSAVFNNTPIVAVLAPNIASWAENHDVPSGKLLIPLSYAAILGGVLTAVGTSTTLVVSGLMQQAGMAPLGLLEPLRLGAPVAVVGGVVIAVLGPRVLPDRRAAHQSFASGAKAFTVSLTVAPDGPVDGASLVQAGLRALRGVYCVQVRRGERVIAPVEPTMELRGQDELTFVGDVHRVMDLQQRRGLRATEAHHAIGIGSDGTQIYEGVIGPSSGLVGSTLKATGFRGRYGAAVIAIHRAGAPIEEKLGEVPLRVGDTLLCIGAPDFPSRAREAGAFALIAAVGADAPLDAPRTRAVALIVGAMLVLAGTGVLTILEAALSAALALVAAKVMSPYQARQAIDVTVIVVIAGAFGLGAAVESSGLAAVIADFVVAVTSPLGTAGLLLGIIVLVMVLTELITNNAAAVLAFPVAQNIAAAEGLAPRAVLVAVAIAASLSFVTPLGYQTNLMVYGLGGYRFGDFAKLGAPVSVATAAALAAGVLVAA